MMSEKFKKRGNKLLIASCIFLLLLSFLQIRINTYTNASQTNFPFGIADSFLSSYSVHAPIDVMNDTALESISTSGDGSVQNPYVIEGWNITTHEEHGVYIQGTTAHFLIRDCWINAENSEYNGIYLNEVSNGTAEISNNIAINCNRGIVLENSDSVKVSDNTCINNQYGIYVFYSKSDLLIRNSCLNNSETGIFIAQSTICNISTNICEYNNFGIVLLSSERGNITGNTIQYNGNGLFLDSDYNLIVNNTFLENDGYAAELTGAAGYNQIHLNSFVDNCIIEYHETQAKDRGFTNLWYLESTKMGNYWSDYNGNTTNPGYEIEGPISEDKYPLNDKDGDEIPDWWEYTYEIDASTDDANRDEEPDGLTNLQEYQYRTDPQNNDTDGDGIPDGAEILFGLNPLFDDANLDSDGDGLSNLDEYQNNADPNNPDTDGDGFSDYEEVILHGTDPDDPKDNRRRNILRNVAIIVPILILGGIAGVFLGLRFRKEKPVMLILISDESGLPIYAKHFLNEDETKPDEALVSGFLSAINAFVKEAFKVKGSIEHIKHEDYALAFKKQESVLFCYVYDGPAHSASQKLNRFISYVLRSSAWKTIPAMVNLGKIDRNVILVLESWISEVFPTKEQEEDQSKKENEDVE